MSLTRREMLGLSLAVVLLPMPQPAAAHRFVNRTGLKTGQFVWEPSQPEAGPVTIIASLRDRLVHVYKAGVLIGISTCQVGHRGRRTPTGVFVVGKQADRADNADRPLAWSGRVLHADDVRSYPASLGCVRVPAPFARLLDDVIHPGTLVILANQRTEPMDVVHSGVLFPMVPVHEASGMVRTVAARSTPEMLTGSADAGHIAVVISRAGRKAVMLRDGVPERETRVSFMQPNTRVGTHVFSLTGATPSGDGLIWLGFGVGRSGRETHLVSWHGDVLLDQISFEDKAGAVALTRALHPGATLIVTDEPASVGRSHSPQDVVLLSTLAPAARARPRTVRRVRYRRQQRRTHQTWAGALIDSWR